jgi:hypothetical protein
MVDQVRLYISAAADLERERDLLGRSVSEVPVQLGWIIHQSPRKNDPLDLDAVTRSDVHLLLMGGDIRAPIGLEWYRARRAGLLPTLLLKRGIHRTLAALNFIRFTGRQANWQPFLDRAELRFNVLSLLADHIVERSAYYGLTPLELDTLKSWRVQLKLESSDSAGDVIGGAGESGQIYSTERYVPSGGILLEPADGEGSAG